MEKQLSLKYIQAEQLRNLDDLNNGEFRRSLIVCSSSDFSDAPVQPFDIVYFTDLKQFHVVTDQNSTELLSSTNQLTASEVIELIRLTQENIDTKTVRLRCRPKNGIVAMYIDGILMYQNKDYKVIDSTIDWSQSDLDQILSKDDLIFLRYNV